MGTQQFDRSRHVPRDVVVKIESSTRSVRVEDADFNHGSYTARQVVLSSQLAESAVLLLRRQVPRNGKTGKVDFAKGTLAVSCDRD